MTEVRIRIGIDGAQSTGKTTLHAELEKRFGDEFEFIPEASREIAERHGVVSAGDWPGLLKSRTRLAAFFEEEEEWLASREQSTGRCIVDSTFFQICAYRKFFLGGCDSGRAKARGYDLIMYCGPFTNGTSDGFRFLEGRSEIDEVYRALIARHYSGVFMLLPDPLEERVRAASEAVAGCLGIS